MKRQEIRTFDEFRDRLDKEKYILVYPYLNRKQIYDLYYRVENGSARASSWVCEKASNSRTSCHCCGNLFVGDEAKHRKCEKVTYKNREELVEDFKATFVLNADVYEVRRVEVISYEESNEFYHKYNKILKAFRTHKCKEPFKGKDIKDFMEYAMEYIVGSSNIQFKKLIARTIKVYSQYPLSDDGYYYITKDPHTKNFTFKRKVNVKE